LMDLAGDREVDGDVAGLRVGKLLLAAEDGRAPP
jgi:hypothetical protein